MSVSARRPWIFGCAAVALAAGCTGGDAGGSQPSPPPAAVIERSLVWIAPELVDDPSVVGLERVMDAFAQAGGASGGGALLADWFDAFATTAHSQRFGPTLLADTWRGAYGSDPSQWDLDALPFVVTAVHNRIDLLRRDASDGHCGELRVSLASTDPTYQPLHVIFLFRQPAGDGDRSGDGAVHCRATARRWAALSDPALDDAAFSDAARALLAGGLVAERALLAESVEQTVSPWEWRQWRLETSPPSNPPLFQTVDVPRLNAPGARRDAFLAWVETNAAALDARTLAIPEEYRGPSARVADGVPREPLDLTGVPAPVLAAHPDLRKNVEIMGCPVCHTADADFVQTRPDRTFSAFYEKELDARKRFLDALASGDAPVAPFGPLQPEPVLPP